MKSKILKKQEEVKETDQDEDEVESELDSGGPKISSAKKNQITIVAVSVTLIAIVLYIFFGGEEQKKEVIKEVAPPIAVVAPSETKSPFEIEPDSTENKVDNVELLQKPSAPEVPELPSLPQELLADQKILPPPDLEQKLQQQQQNQSINEVQQPQNNLNNQQQIPPVANQMPTEVAKVKEVNPRYSPIIVFSGGGAGPALGVGYDKNIVNLNEDPIAALAKTQSVVKTTYIDDRVHSITQGKLLTAVLETAINTEIPGFVRAIVSRDVYGESGNEVLIPRGSRLFGAYSSKVIRGQGRVDIGWTRLIRTDGVDLAITFNASDQFGRSGIPGEVDAKYGSVIANSLLTSFLAVGGAALAQKIIGTNNNTTATTTAGVTTTTGNASAQVVADVAKTIVDTASQVVSNTLDVNPVITVPQGTKITVIVNSDIKIPSMAKR
ncbi:MAG: TrbI/VirB10 family protein [Pelagibacterales bacterium]|nr:TrbI/VirB10 family protein [Pelagibacterales bacterium]